MILFIFIKKLFSKIGKHCCVKNNLDVVDRRSCLREREQPQRLSESGPSSGATPALYPVFYNNAGGFELNKNSK
jgi:hypothetical protein